MIFEGCEKLPLPLGENRGGWGEGRSSARRLHVAAVLCVAAMLLLAAGCATRGRIGGATPSDEVIDDLRAENVQLRQEVEQLQQNVAGRLSQIEALQQQMDGAAPGIEGAAVPTLTSVRLDRYSGAVDGNNDGIDDLLRLYVLTLDQKGRFMPVAGRATVQVVVTPTESDPHELARRVFEPSEFDAAYRSGFLGTHYTLEVVLPADLCADVDSATVKITFTDAAAGTSLSHEAIVRIDAKPD